MQITQETILENLEQPRQLEQLYRENKSEFRQALQEAFERQQNHPVLRVWNERLNYVGESSISWGTRKDWWRILLLCLVAGTLIKFPNIFSLEEARYY